MRRCIVSGCTVLEASAMDNNATMLPAGSDGEHRHSAGFPVAMGVTRGERKRHRAPGTVPLATNHGDPCTSAAMPPGEWTETRGIVRSSRTATGPAGSCCPPSNPSVASRQPRRYRPLTVNAREPEPTTGPLGLATTQDAGVRFFLSPRQQQDRRIRLGLCAVRERGRAAALAVAIAGAPGWATASRHSVNRLATFRNNGSYCPDATMPPRHAHKPGDIALRPSPRMTDLRNVNQSPETLKRMMFSATTFGRQTRQGPRRYGQIVPEGPALPTDQNAVRWQAVVVCRPMPIGILDARLELTQRTPRRARVVSRDKAPERVLVRRGPCL
jgi:hypothetical protein